MSLDPLDRESEPYSQYGNISAEGIQRLLGAPHLDALQVLIRETVQNSWDAGKDLPGSVDYRIRFRELNSAQHAVLREYVFCDLPQYDKNQSHSIRKILNRNRITAIEICDFGTTGLGGATNPEDVPEEGESPDFVDFIRNIGSPRDTVYGGGTYGYGKSCLYAFSQCRAILVDSVTQIGRSAERRVMGCRVSARYDIKSGPEQGRYTGRHWWGRRKDNSILEPLSGSDAEELSRLLGMCSRDTGDLGTSILILEPQLDCESLEEAANKAVEILLWYCWPKMVVAEGASAPAMTFSVEINGEALHVPKPDECPPLNHFTKSLRKVRTAGEDAVEIRSQRPARHLGYLFIERGFRAERLPGFSDSDNSLFPRVASHVALMRPAELVVKYAVGEPLPSDDVEWGGVFVCSHETEVEQAFAAAEPPAHDDWDPQSLPKGHQKTFVNVALRRIREQMNEISAHLAVSPNQDDARASLGPAADVLGAMLSSAEGQRLGTRRTYRRSPSVRRRHGTTVSRPVFIGHEMREGQSCAVFEVALSGSGAADVVLKGKARILKEGGGADKDDARGKRSRVIAWRSHNGEEVTAPEIQVSVDGEQKMIAVVAIPRGKAISLTVAAEEL